MEIELRQRWKKWKRGKKKKSRGKRRRGQNTQARCREMIQNETSDFLVSSHKYFDKELGIYQKGKKKNRGCLPEDPTLLEFNDLICVRLQYRDSLSCLSLMASGALFTQQYLPHGYQRSGIKNRGCRGTVWIPRSKTYF